jgi:quercetin dioxygenase-like cupin family protein
MAGEGTMQAPAPLLLDRDEGQALWFNNDLLTVKATGSETGGAFLLIEELARQGKVTPLHNHPHEAESFAILEGELLLYLDGDERTLGVGAFALVPPGVPHSYIVTSDVARTLILITPGSGAMEAFFRDASEPAGQRALPAERPLDIERIAAAAERTGAVKILGPPPFGPPAA